jgi:hypothetical protein
LITRFTSRSMALGVFGLLSVALVGCSTPAPKPSGSVTSATATIAPTASAPEAPQSDNGDFATKLQQNFAPGFHANEQPRSCLISVRVFTQIHRILVAPMQTVTQDHLSTVPPVDGGGPFALTCDYQTSPNRELRMVYGHLQENYSVSCPGGLPGYTKDGAGPGDASYFASNVASASQPFAISNYLTCSNGDEMSLSFQVNTSKESWRPPTIEQQRSLAAFLLVQNADVQHAGLLIVAD